MENEVKNEVNNNALEDKWLNSRDAAEYLGISQQSLRVKVWRGELKPRYLGSRYRFKKSYLDGVILKKVWSDDVD